MHRRQAPLIYEFGQFQLDSKRRVLSSLADGQPLQVTAKVFDTLLYFVERAGELLDKRALLEALWPNVVVEEGNLTQTIHTLRRVLGERPDEHRFIVTVPGRGYRFVAEVKEQPPSEQLQDVVDGSRPPPARPTGRKVLALVALSLAGVGVLLYSYLRWSAQRPPTPPAVPMPSIAVLPFVDMSPGHDHEYFGDGLSEEILNLLAQSPALRVIARTSSFSFKDQTPDIATIADKLDVTHVLEGSVRKSGERIRITAQLVDGATSVHLWSQTYDRDLEDVFEVQTEIADKVAESLHVTLNIADRPTRGETTSTVAFEQYLQGRYFFNRRDSGDVARAREHFEQAVQIDPNYARAWAGLAGAYWVGENADRKMPEEVAPKWREAVERALTLGPNLAAAHVRAAQYHLVTGNAAAAKEHFRRAKALSPNDPLVLGVAASDEDLDQTITHWQRVVAIDPLSVVHRSNLGSYLMAAGRWEEAKAAFRAVLEMSPTQHEARASICRTLVLQERFNDALDTALQLPDGYRKDQCLALVHYAKRRNAPADAALARLIALSEQPRTDVEVKLLVGEVYAYRGMNDEAFEWLNLVSRQTRDDRAVRPAWWIQEELPLSPFLQPLHEDPRWQSLLARADES